MTGSFLAVLLAVAVQSCKSLSTDSSADPVVVIDTPMANNTNVELLNDFVFSCTVTEPKLNLTLVIDDTFDSSKLNRINATVLKEDGTGMLYTFENVLTTDNGTTFACLASNTTGNDTYLSDVLTLQVLAPPVFSVASNQSLYAFMKNGTNDYLNCTISYSNPPLTKLTLDKNSKGEGKNVKLNETEGIVKFTNATLSNRGNYTCNAVNEVGKSYIRYETFVGGAPNSLSIDVIEQLTDNGTLAFTVHITDHSNAPAQSVVLNMFGLVERELVFDDLGLHIPVNDDFENVFAVNQSDVFYGNYSFIVDATNELGTNTTNMDSVFLNGTLPLEVTTVPELLNVTEGDDYTFTCIADVLSTTGAFFTFTVLIDNESKGPKYDRLIKGQTERHSQTYTFQNTTYMDEGTMFTCIANEHYTSPGVTMDVFYAPKGESSVTVPPKTVGDPSFTITINYTANPPLTYYQWMRNGELIVNETHVVPYFNTIQFLSLAPNDNGSYSVTLYNEEGNLTVFFDMMVYYTPRPKGNSSIAVPTKTVGDPGFTVTINYTANPPLTYYQWMRNGQALVNDSRVVLYFNSIEFLSLAPIDNGTYSLILFNKAGNSTISFDLMVLYGPLLSIPQLVGGFINQSLVVDVSVDSNPVNYTVDWLIDDEPLVPTDNVMVDRNVLHFMNLTDSDVANYTIIVTNDIGSENETFQLVAYDGPYFNEGPSNGTLLKENKTGINFNFTCSVKSAVPEVHELTFEPANGSNWHSVRNGTESITIVFSGSNKNNTGNFTCKAINNATVSTLTFRNYIGGPPDNVSVEIAEINANDSVVLNAKVTDRSSVPATHVIFYVKDVTKGNVTKPIKAPLVDSVVFDSIVSASYKDLGMGTAHVMKIYAKNMVGTAFVMDYTFKVPDAPSPSPKTKHHKSHAGAIAAGVLVPLAVIALIAIGVGAFFYYKRKQSRSGFSIIPDSDDTAGNINSPGYHTDKIVT